MPRRPAPLQVPSLDVLSQRPIPGAPALLGRALSSIPDVLSGRQLDTSGVLLASASSELCPAQLAWNGRPYIGAIDRAELFRMATAKHRLTPPDPWPSGTVPLLVSIGRRGQLIALSWPKGGRP